MPAIYDGSIPGSFNLINWIEVDKEAPESEIAAFSRSDPRGYQFYLNDGSTLGNSLTVEDWTGTGMFEDSEFQADTVFFRCLANAEGSLSLKKRIAEFVVKAENNCGGSLEIPEWFKNM